MHDRVEALISERLDGGRLAPRRAAEVEEHLETCEPCRTFERRAYHLRDLARFEVLTDVPDIVERVMADVRREAPQRRRWSARHGGRWTARLVPAIATFIVGAIIGSVLIGGPLGTVDGGSTAIAAADIARGIAGIAPSIDAFDARYRIVERDLEPGLAQRELEMHVWFEAPERFRLDVTDLTSYAHPTTPTDIRLIVDGSRWYVSAPDPCPAPVCGERDVLVRHRTPFSSSAPAPTDVVLPMTALGDPTGVRVLGRSTVLGRPAVEVDVPFERAAPLFPFLSLGGRWRPFFAEDRVHVWLDATSWFPLRWEVFPSDDPARRAWELRFGLPREPAGRPIFDVTATAVTMATPAASTFAIPTDAGETRDGGASATTTSGIDSRTGFRPLQPADRAGLVPYRSVTLDDGTRSLVTYADGLAYLTVGETRSWADPSPFGPLGATTERVSLGADGVGYFEPADAGHGRRLAIHAAGTDLYLESNLSRATLVRVAASLPVRGLPMPRAWRVQRAGDSVTRVVPLRRAASIVGFAVAPPASLPHDLDLATVQVTRVGTSRGVTMSFRAASNGLAEPSLRLHVERGTRLPPASSPHQLVVDVGGVAGRWTPDRSQLEWVENGVYRSLDGPGLTLERALAIASSIPRSTP